MPPKVGMRCTVVYGKSLGVPLNILGSVFCMAFDSSMLNWYVCYQRFTFKPRHV